MNRKKTNVINRYKNILLLGAIFVLFISIAGFSIKFLDIEKNQHKIKGIELALMDLKAAMNIDSVRQYNIQKIMSIMDRYNSSLPSNTKYEIADEIYSLSQKYTNLDVDLICATITHESALSWDPMVTSKAGAMGIMQIMPVTGIYLTAEEGMTWTSAEEILYDPIYNLRLGCRFLSTLIEIYGIEGGLAAYNGGEKLAALWLANNKAKGILYAETEKYIPFIMKLYEEFQNASL